MPTALYLTAAYSYSQTGFPQCTLDTLCALREKLATNVSALTSDEGGPKAPSQKATMEDMINSGTFSFGGWDPKKGFGAQTEPVTTSAPRSTDPASETTQQGLTEQRTLEGHVNAWLLATALHVVTTSLQELPVSTSSEVGQARKWEPGCCTPREEEGSPLHAGPLSM